MSAEDRQASFGRNLIAGRLEPSRRSLRGAKLLGEARADEKAWYTQCYRKDSLL